MPFKMESHGRVMHVRASVIIPELKYLLFSNILIINNNTYYNNIYYNNIYYNIWVIISESQIYFSAILEEILEATLTIFMCI